MGGREGRREGRRERGAHAQGWNVSRVKQESAEQRREWQPTTEREGAKEIDAVRKRGK